MSEDIDKIWMEGLPKDKIFLMINICAVAKEIICGRCSLEYIKTKMELIMNEVKKISAD